MPELRKRYDAEARLRPFQALPQIGDHGLTLGRGTVISLDDRCFSQGLGADDGARICAVLSAAYGREIAPPVIKYVERAAKRWREGDPVLAHIELAFAGLPRLETEDAAFRLFLADALLAEGLSPFELAEGLGLDTDVLKYDPSQPRVPAGNGRASGQWGSGSGSNALLGLPAAATQAAGRSFLADASPAIVRALEAFAARFSVPTAVLGALFIPTPNSGGVTDGMLPEASDIRFRRDGPAGTLTLAATAADGGERVVRAQNQRGVYVDAATGTPLGRDFGEQFYIDLGAVRDALKPREKDQPAATEEEPQLCPAPVPDTPHPSKKRALDFEDDLHRRVNPLVPIPRGFAVRIVDPETGEWQYPDDCFRYAGDLVDGDMKAGDFADAKGEGHAKILNEPRIGEMIMAGLVDQAKRHLRAARFAARG